MRRSSYGPDPYPELREVLAPELAELPPEEIESAIAALYGGEMSAEDLENFWKGLKKAGRSIGRVAQTALPIVGTVAGTAFGGPVGAALGGALGQAASGAIGGALAPGSRRGAGRRVLAGLTRGATQGLGGAAGALPGPFGQIAGALAGGAAGGRGPGGAAGQLLKALSRPETMRALGSMMLGPAGRRSVPVAGTPVPTAAFANLLGVLGNQAAAESHQFAGAEPAGTPVYLLNDAGESIGDPYDAQSRAEVLFARLAEAEAIERAEALEAAEYEAAEWEETSWDELLAEEEEFWTELALAEAEED